ncbi:MAG TPA: hypothetical protein VMF32_10980, partial [Xanthobacteraceae bacterium]|nr:hypothetical protein [Xanthobacteraceae bacterium]
RGKLSRLALIADPESRQFSFSRAMKEIAEEEGSETAEELRYLLEAVQLSRRHSIPALSLDALRAAACHPAVPIRLLWEANDASIQAIVEIEDELPFLWCLADPASLRHAVRRLLRTLREAGLSHADAIEAADAKLTQMVALCPQTAAACWVAREANGVPHCGNGEVPLAQFRQLVPSLRTCTGIRRLSDDEWRRSVSRTHDWQNFPEDVRIDAPAYAADLVATRTTPTELDVAVLRHLREQNPDEFDFRFRAAFQLAVAISGTLP